MFPAQRPRADPDELSRSRGAGHLTAAKQKAHSDSPRAVAPLAHEVDDALWEDAALRAADYDNIDGRLPVEPEHVTNQIVKPLPKPPSAVASEDQVLSEELLTNDSLGG